MQYKYYPKKFPINNVPPFPPTREKNELGEETSSSKERSKEYSQRLEEHKQALEEKKSRYQGKIENRWDIIDI